MEGGGRRRRRRSRENRLSHGGGRKALKENGICHSFQGTRRLVVLMLDTELRHVQSCSDLTLARADHSHS